jgi:ATP-dependent Clp protease adaptor protein ClpS
LWNVVLLDDQDHTYDYVIRMMQDLFGHDKTRADQIAYTVDRQGRAVCATTHKEHAELKREQIVGFGRDPLVPQSKGAMRAVIEPAECESDKDKNENAN